MDADDLARRRVLLVGAAAKLHASEVDYAAGQVSGRVNDLPVTFRLDQSAARERITVLEARVPHLPLDLELRPRTPTEERLAGDGFALDLEVGDAEFDETFMVEGAPADVVRALLDEGMRRLLLEERRATLALHGETGALALSRPGWLEEGGAVNRFLRLGYEVASRLEAAFLVADAVAAQPGSGDVYRGGPGPEARRATEATRERDRARLLEVHRRRTTWQRLRRLLERIAGMR